MSNYLHLFANENARTTYEGGNSYEEPYVSLVGENSIHFNKDYKALIKLVDGDEIKIYGNGVLTAQELSQYEDVQEVVITRNCTGIANYAFTNVFNFLETIVIQEGMTSLGNYLFSDYGNILENVTLPQSLRTIGEGSFYNCEILSNINIPNKLTTIGDFAFKNSGIFSITLPETIVSIGEAALQAPGLESIVILAQNPPTLGDFVFDGIVADYTIYVPENSLNAYKTATNWSEYADRIQPIQ